MKLSRLAREPMVHFAIIGIALFVVHGRMTARDSEGKRIVVTQAIVEDIERQFEATWSRAPTATELPRLVDAYVRDEILYREGLALGLDRDDPVIKRRVRQKLEVMAEEDAAEAEPSDAELSAFLAANSARFERPAVLSFAQVFLGDLAPGPDRDRAVTEALAALERGSAPESVGRPTLLPIHADAVAADLVARDFDQPFSEALEQLLPLGEWAGPVPSSYGQHLVLVTARTPAAVPALESVRAEVMREWEHERRERSLETRFAALRATYDVRIEGSLEGGRGRS
jgi:hypothetical protein